MSTKSQKSQKSPKSVNWESVKWTTRKLESVPVLRNGRESKYGPLYQKIDELLLPQVLDEKKTNSDYLETTENIPESDLDVLYKGVQQRYVRRGYPNIRLRYRRTTDSKTGTPTVCIGLGTKRNYKNSSGETPTTRVKKTK